MAKRYRKPRYDRDGIDREFFRSDRSKARTDSIVDLDETLTERGRSVAYVKTRYETEDEQLNPRVVDVTTLGVCGNGHVLSEKNPVAGRCTIEGCQKILCGARGCCYSCMACGLTMCRQHAVFYAREGGEQVEIYCTRVRCRLSYHVSRFLGFWFGVED